MERRHLHGHADGVEVELGDVESSEVILSDTGARSNNCTKGTPNLQADLFGDWREEIAWRSADSSELRIYSTTDETDLRIRTLMHDPVYRLSVAWQNTGYNQPPQTSFFLGDGMELPAAPRIAVTGARRDRPMPRPRSSRECLRTAPCCRTAARSRWTITAADPESGVRNLDVAFDGEPVAPGATLALKGKAGPHTLTVRAVNHDGGHSRQHPSRSSCTPTRRPRRSPPAARCRPTAAGRTACTTATFTVSMNLWSGVNGSVFRLYENGTLIATKLLDAALAQGPGGHGRVTGKPNGTYVYTGELINAKGATATTSVTVTVKDAAPGVPVVSHDNTDKDGNYTVTTEPVVGHERHRATSCSRTAC